MFFYTWLFTSALFLQVWCATLINYIFFIFIISILQVRRGAPVTGEFSMFSILLFFFNYIFIRDTAAFRLAPGISCFDRTALISADSTFEKRPASSPRDKWTPFETKRLAYLSKYQTKSLQFHNLSKRLITNVTFFSFLSVNLMKWTTPNERRFRWVQSITSYVFSFWCRF